MGVDVAHLVLEALGDTDDHVVDERTDGTESGDVLAGTVVHLDLDDILRGLLEGDGQVTKVLLEGAAGTLDSDLASLDVDLDCTEKVPLVLSCPCRNSFMAQHRIPPHISRCFRSRCICRIGVEFGSDGFWGNNAPPSGTLRLSSEWMYLILPVCCGLVEGCTCRCQSRVDLRRRSRRHKFEAHHALLAKS